MNETTETMTDTETETFYAVRVEDPENPQFRWLHHMEFEKDYYGTDSHYRAEQAAQEFREQFPGVTYTVVGVTAPKGGDMDTFVEVVDPALDPTPAHVCQFWLAGVPMTAQQVQTLLDRKDEAYAAIVRDLTASRRHHHEDIERIGNRLIQEAEDRGWCDQFDSIVDEVNRDLHVELPTREKDFDLTFTVSVTVNVTTTGRNGDQALADWELDRNEIIEAVRNGDWEVESSDWSESEG